MLLITYKEGVADRRLAHYDIIKTTIVHLSRTNGGRFCVHIYVLHLPFIKEGPVAYRYGNTLPLERHLYITKTENVWQPSHGKQYITPRIT